MKMLNKLLSDVKMEQVSLGHCLGQPLSNEDIVHTCEHMTYKVYTEEHTLAMALRMPRLSRQLERTQTTFRYLA